ncbi:MAG TPA: nucleoside-diphosphate kinase [Candidatus Marinimicrobia bacterium]|nr:nucleoside-diphosphate kinase [Candidatus Neomarinimicrobiota bacterium]MDP6142726.1 nucleoside-diphosphate kinase [Candidatus Neomarinimicrobiota bacterium]MDP6260866.1 nucleoside-diphosphate kinase [Candidatus Neomarinimicrobiota bacterium]MDP7128018.1 nucleoside-diphosphate kinase [Candidatus Neomarinimicrobiota bacterium]MDP7337027.1 nucleoside-diphosphate kinase [Candidatus Neomarinimicrobiota bacterium]
MTRTLAIIKPDAVNAGYTGKILDKIIQEDFRILGMKQIKMSLQRAQGFYAVHTGKPFFEELTKFMSSGPCIVLALEKENAVDSWREVIGATNPEEADEGTIRKEFAKNVGENAVHGSDSDENGLQEIAFFFSEAELIGNK